MKNKNCSVLNILENKNRPNSINFIDKIFTDFIELCGDRLFGDDSSIIGGIALLTDIPVTVIGQIRGKTAAEQFKVNYSMTHPEGFRKAIRLMKQAEKFNRPVICFVDTIGAYPGKQAEERGQSSAIANSLIEMMYLKVPVITLLIGYGGSGGALALCAADRIAILENAVLSVISPKACAEILWKDINREREAFDLLKMTSNDLFQQGIVDIIIPEPNEGAHSDESETAIKISDYLIGEIQSLYKLSMEELIMQRQNKFRKLGMEKNK